MARGDAAVAAARALVGARFRLHGRDPAWGLDCVGVVAIALGRPVAGDYPLRGRTAADIARAARAAGLTPVAEMQAGDMVATDAGGGQLHLAIVTGNGFVHAHAGLRRVVESPGRPDGVIGIWRGD